MTRDEALSIGYCKHCAAYGGDRQWRCGVTQVIKRHECILPAEAVERWKGEHGLSGAVRRSSGKFGDRELMKKKRGRKEKRYLK